MLGRRGRISIILNDTKGGEEGRREGEGGRSYLTMPKGEKITLNDAPDTNTKGGEDQNLKGEKITLNETLPKGGEEAMANGSQRTTQLST